MKLVKFEAPWCAGCKVLSSTLDTFFSDHQLVKEMTTYDMDVSPESAQLYGGIRSLPTLIILDDMGNVVKRTGNAPKEKLAEFLS